MSKLRDYVNTASAGDYVKFAKDSTVTVRLITAEPVFSMPVWITTADGKRRRINSISVDREGRKTKHRCPFLPLAGQDDKPRIQLTYGVYNFDLEKVQIMPVGQLSILRALDQLDQQIAKMKPAKGKPAKTLLDFKIAISRSDANGKTSYNVGFAPDSSEPWTEEEIAAVDEALDPDSPSNIHKLIDQEVQWPSEEYLEKIGLEISSPLPYATTATEPPQDEELTEESIPF